MATIMPPGGFLGFAQQNQANRMVFSQAVGRGGSSGARRKANRASKRTRKAARGSRGSKTKRSGGKMKFGSPAWQKKYKVGKFRKKK